MNILDWGLNRSLRRMMRDYFVSRAAGTDHTQALQMIVQRWHSKSPTKAHEFWDSYWRINADPLVTHVHYVRPNETKEATELKSLVYCLLQGGTRTLGGKGMWMFEQIEEIYDKLKAEFRIV